MKLIKFTRQYGIYWPGDVAGFIDEKADHLVEIGCAEVIEPEQRAPEVRLEARPFPELAGRRPKGRKLSATEEGIDE